jgi:hypothetical protein
MKRIEKVDESGVAYEEDIDLGDVHDELEAIQSSLQNLQRQVVGVLASLNIVGWAIVVLLLMRLPEQYAPQSDLIGKKIDLLSAGGGAIDAPILFPADFKLSLERARSGQYDIAAQHAKPLACSNQFSI